MLIAVTYGFRIACFWPSTVFRTIVFWAAATHFSYIGSFGMKSTISILQKIVASLKSELFVGFFENLNSNGFSTCLNSGRQ